MGWNEARLWMVAPGYSPGIERNGPNEPALLSFCRQNSVAAVEPNEILLWLESHGFRPARHRRGAFEKDGCEALLETNASPSSVRLTFTILDLSLKKLVFRQFQDRWARIVFDFHHDLGFRLVDIEAMSLVGAEEFLRLLEQDILKRGFPID